MQQGHPRHKQLRRARHEMYLHNRLVFALKISTGINNFVSGVGDVIVNVGKAITKLLTVVTDGKG
ncbi:hypothetical protein [Leuconostoc citreum]|uniref:hypothetical protein n=1 Tax=Leuconostoc citreum TaxID=33964 RepID=UPI0032DFE8EA